MPFHPDGPGFGDHSWWASGGRPIVMLAMFAILMGVLVWAVLRFTSTNGPAGSARAARPGGSDRALDELRVRYARGEMGREEFVQRFRDLGGSGLDPAPSPAPAPEPPPGPAPTA